MEEDIKNLSEIIELCEEEINNNDENVSAILDLTDLKSLRNLIKEYKNLKEIEENHRKENGELREKVKQIEEENKTLNERNQYLVKYRAKLEKELYESNENYIPVSLVEEKIEELNKLITEAQKELGSASKEYTIYVYQKDILQELLEKR